ncbi:recombinase family protein [Alcaligenes aquatilis]|uniref:hypothetical protein n=1 Tax=Alcaligenes aquatilis TaxID=323284 RepID=UPI00361266C1
MATQQSVSTSLAQARQGAQAAPPVVAGFFDLQGFELMQRTAKAFASSSLVPQQYQGNLANCMIAMDMAQRIGANPLMVMQNLYIVHGNPGWSSKFLIATINVCGRYSSLRYEWKGKPGSDDFGCRAWAIEKATDERLDGIWVTWEMVKAEGWHSKKGSKWATMPDQMFVYRAAAFWQRAYAPELGMGLSTAEELADVIDAKTGVDGSIQVDVDALRAQGETQQAAKADDTANENVTDVELTEAKEQKAQEGNSQPPAQDYLDAEKVLVNIQGSKDHEILGLAADNIQDCHPDEQERLSAAYRQRLDELDGVVHVPADQPTQAPAQTRTRRAAADME